MSVVEDKFKRIGARLDLRTEFDVMRVPEPKRGEPVPSHWRGRSPMHKVGTESVDRFSINVQGDRFIVNSPPDTDLIVMDVQPADRHLLLLAKDGDHVARFLCGHDERQWFVASVADGSNVAQAKEALKPTAVLNAEKGVRSSKRSRRRNKARVRQGDWFFLPVALDVSEAEILHREPLMRQAGGHVHLLEEAYRSGGEQVYVPTLVRNANLPLEQERSLRTRFNLGATDAERDAFFKEMPEARDWTWVPQVRNPDLFARGKVTHPEHRTIKLAGWHRVLPNAEASGSRGWADTRFQNGFLD